MRSSRRISNDGPTDSAMDRRRHVEFLVIERHSPPMNGGREVSESLVTCSPCSRIGCHVAVKRATRGPPRRSLYRATPSRTPSFPFAYVRSTPCGRTSAKRYVVKPMGPRNVASPPQLARFRATSIMSAYSVGRARARARARSRCF